ncbi:MAG: 16S rRNA (uracil(1498)-N(3))-methyltransferase [Chitinophagaceae bacterium]|nr:16S rRNA (uracil(1498)-N(3))-methyltransferase [Chitinophagaceae bacterium]
MSTPFFFESALDSTSSHFTLSEETSKHCIQVLRMKMGEELQLTDGKGLLCTATIASEDKKKTVVTITKSELRPVPVKRISIAISLLKNASRFEWFLEKATEIGVTDIQPLICKRTEHGKFKAERMHGILVAAMLQSQQVWLPVLHEPVKFEKYIPLSAWSQKLIAHCEEEKKQLLHEVSSITDTQILIGPEGDFSPDEIKLALDNGYLPVSLGDTRLRAETAGMVAAVLLVNR